VAATCPWCSAARAAGPTCPRCGANYAKAEQIKTQGRAVAVPVPEPAVLSEPVFAGAVLAAMEDRAVDDPALEFKLSVAAVPAMLAVALLFHLFLPGLQRIFLGMPIHELGHALTAWFTGYAAIPTLWKTIIFDERSWSAPSTSRRAPRRCCSRSAATASAWCSPRC
jgi:hypothetical protein